MPRSIWIVAVILSAAVLLACEGEAKTARLMSSTPEIDSPTATAELTPSEGPSPTPAVITTPDQQPTIDPDVVPTATATRGGDDIKARRSVPITLQVGQVAEFDDLGLTIELLEAHEVPSDCFDCPLKAALLIGSGAETVQLNFTFSGNMPLELLEAARQKTAFGYVIYIVKIVEGSVDLKVD